MTISFCPLPLSVKLSPHMLSSCRAISVFIFAASSFLTYIYAVFISILFLLQTECAEWIHTALLLIEELKNMPGYEGLLITATGKELVAGSEAPTPALTPGVNDRAEVKLSSVHLFTSSWQRHCPLQFNMCCVI